MNLERILIAYAQVVRDLIETPGGQAFIGTTFIYLNWTSGLTTQQVIAVFSRISTEAGNTAMSAAQQLINQGVEQGIELGVRGMLKLDMDATTIAATFDMSQTEVERLIEKIRKEPK